MSSTVDFTGLTDGDSSSSLLKRRRSSTLNCHETDNDQTPSKRVRPCSPSSSTGHFLFDHSSDMNSIVNSLNDILQTHRNLIREYVQLQMHDRVDLSVDEQRFIQSEEDLIEKAEKNLSDIHQSSSRHGKRQRMQSMTSTSPTFDRVKHETHILKRIEELKSDGKWTPQRLAKCLEPNKRKTHWDYLLDEMRWLAEDFQLEKRWKQAMAKKISQAILKYFREKKQNEMKLFQQLRQRAQFISREVMLFWRNMSQIAEWKQTTRAQELHQHQVDLQLNLLDESDRSNLFISSRDDDDETTDDEETIEQEEQYNDYNRNELKELQDDHQLPIETLLKRHYGLELSDFIDQNSDDEQSNSIITDDRLTVDQYLSRAQSIHPRGVTFDRTNVDIPISFLLKYSLREYQHIALQWLVKSYDNQLNSILADDIGLGKRIETIALLAYLASEKGVWGPHLIVVPTRLMLQWEFQLKNVCPSLKIFIYYGSTRDRHEWTRDSTYHVCLTSYQHLRQDIQLFSRKKWIYNIFDRAEQIKNFHSHRWSSLFNLQCQYRLLLCDYLPWDDDIRSWIHFLMSHLFTSDEEFHQWSHNFNGSIECLKKWIEPLILSRSKIDVEQQLPEKNEHLYICDLTQRQQHFYQTILQSSMTKDYFSMINSLMQLRKVCNHPELIQSRTSRSSVIFNEHRIQYLIPKLILQFNRKNPSLGFHSLFHDKFLYFHTKFTLHVTEEMTHQHYDHDDDDSSRVILTKEILERYRGTAVWNGPEKMNNKKSRNHLRIKPNKSLDLHCDDYHSRTNSNDLESISDCQFFHQIHLDHYQYPPWYGTDALEQIQLALRPCHISYQTTFNGYAHCQQINTKDHSDVLRRLIKSTKDRFDEFQSIHERFVMCTRRVLAYPIQLDPFNEREQTRPLIEILSSSDTDVLSSIHHIEQLMTIEYPDRRYLQYDCGKLQTLDVLLMKLKCAKHRCLIFTQMFDMLDLLEQFCKSHHYSYLRCDTNLDSIQRTILIERFHNDKKIFLIISSTRIADFRVNRTGADTVIFYDFEWHPTIEEKLNNSIDNITIYRLVSKNTIEEKISGKINGKQSNVSYFTKNSLRDLLDHSSISDNSHSMATDDRSMIKEYEEAIRSVEDPIDRQAIDEFHRTMLIDFNEFNSDGDDLFTLKQSIDTESQTIDEQLRPIERYALRCVETHRHQFGSNGYLNGEQLCHDWQMSCMKAVEEEEQKDDDGMIYTYTRDYDKKIWVTEDGQTFEIWSGILIKYPIEDHGEYYIDDVLDFGYESEAMIIEPEEYIRFPLPKALADATNTSKSDSNIFVPRSLFDRSNLLLNPQSTSLTTNALNKTKPLINSPKILHPTLITTPQTPPQNIKARQLFVNNGTTTTPLPNISSTNVMVPASTGPVRSVKIEENLSKDNIQGLLEIDNSDWLISEDYKVLDAIQNIQQLPLSSISYSSTSNANKPPMMLPNPSSTLLPSTTTLSSSSTVNNTTNALTQNWDFISDIVNRYSRILRTPKQCKHRFEQIIGPREEGRVVYDPVKKKKHVIKGTVKLSDDNLQTCRTNQLFVHENCQKLTQIYHQKFETITQCDSQISPIVYLNKFKQMQLAQATHHQMRGLRQGSLLHENNINYDLPLTPGDVLYQRSEREKDLKQQQQQVEVLPTNLSAQQTTSNNVETLKQTPTNVGRSRPSPLNTPSIASINAPSSNPVQRSLSTNIIVSGNHPTRTTNNVLTSRANLTSSPTPTVTTVSNNLNSSVLPTTTIVPGQRTVQVLPPNHLSTTETNPIPQKPMGTIQIPSNEYHHPRPVTHPQPTSTITTTPSNLQVRAHNYARNPTSSTNLTTLEVRPQLPPSPKSQQPAPPTRSLSVTARPNQTDFLSQTQTKVNPTSMPQSPVSVAMVRPLQHPSTPINPSISSSVNVTLPTNKLTTSTTSLTNPNQSQLRTTTAAAFLSNALPNTNQSQSVSQQFRQLVTNSSPTTNVNQPTNTTQRLSDPNQRPTSNIQRILPSRTPIAGQVRNVRIVTLTPGTANPTAIIADSTSTNNSQQPKISYNRPNSTTGADLPPEIAAQVQRIKAMHTANSDHNDNNPPQRTVYVPARALSSGTSSSTPKLKTTGSLDPVTLALAAKTSQANIVFHLPSNSGGSSTTVSTSGADEQTTNLSSNLPRQAFTQHFNIIPSSPRPQSPTTTTSMPFSRLLQYLPQMRPAAVANNPPTPTAVTPIPHDQTTTPSSTTTPTPSSTI